MVLIFDFLMRNAKIRCGDDIRFTAEFEMTGVSYWQISFW